MEMDLEAEIDSIVNNEIYSNHTKGELYGKKAIIEDKDEEQIKSSKNTKTKMIKRKESL